jgi:hypothetical protein
LRLENAAAPLERQFFRFTQPFNGKSVALRSSPLPDLAPRSSGTAPALRPARRVGPWPTITTLPLARFHPRPPPSASPCSHHPFPAGPHHLQHLPTDLSRAANHSC